MRASDPCLRSSTMNESPMLRGARRRSLVGSSPRRRLLLSWLSVLSLTLTTGAAAQQVAVATAPTEPEPPSVFQLGYQGLLAGAAVGIAGGYLLARKDDFQSHDWRKLGLGLGIGALAGAGLGVALGVADRAGAKGARYVARDLSLGVVFGAVVGTIAGGISAIVKDDAEHVGYGASVGAIAGAGLGIVVGIIEGAARRRSAPTTSTAVTARVRIRPTLARATAPEGTRAGALLPGLAGYF